MNFPLSHISSLCKYTGISFTAGAITHGFFSGERSFWTAVFGVALYLLGSTLEKIAHPDKKHTWTDLLAIGIVASIGLGFFTGGLQHFPDSPARSAWVVPVGFAMSLLAMYLMEGKGLMRVKALLTYGTTSLAIVIGAFWYGSTYFQEHGGDSHGQEHQHAATQTDRSIREFRIEANDAMRFYPAQWDVVAGEAVRIVLVNKGKVDHELVIGTEKELMSHAKTMASLNKGDHHANAITAKPGETAQLAWTFAQPGEYAMACFEPGHYEAGMKGVINVGPRRP